MTYVNSAAFAGRGSKLQYSTNPPSVAYTILAEIKTIQFSGMKADLADVTNFQSSNFREWLPTLNDSGEIAFTGNLIPNDASASDLLGFFNNQTPVIFQVVLPASSTHPVSEGTYTFKAYVVSIERSVPVDKEATISGKLKITAQITFTAGS